MMIIEADDARRIALDYLFILEQETGEALKLVDTETIERGCGWVFFYNSRDYIETGRFRSMLTGNAPFIVDRNSGEIHIMGTAKPTDDYIADYEQQRQQK